MRVAFSDLGSRYPAAIGARRAVGCFFDLFGDLLQTSFNEAMVFQPCPEPLILLALLLPGSSDLHEVAYHSSIIAVQTTPLESVSGKSTHLETDNEEVTDRLYLSIWLTRMGRANRVLQFEKLLRTFPFSQRPQPQSTLIIQAIDTTEPPLLERAFNGTFDVAEVIGILGDYSGDDVAYRLETWWDLWLHDNDWVIAPVRVALCCFGPDFDNGTDAGAADQEDLRVEFGVDSHYLPRHDIPGSAKLIESNIKSLLHLVHELDSVLLVENRKLETESGQNFADRLQQILTRSTVQ